MHVLSPDLVAKTRTADTLRVSTLFFWAFMLAAIYLFIDPLNPGYQVTFGNLRLPRDLGPVKYSALVIGWMALVLSVLGLNFNNRNGASQLRTAFVRSWPIIVSALFMFIGSMVARVHFDHQETFLPAAASMTAYVVGLAYMFEVRDPVKTVQGYFLLLALVAPFMIWEIVDRWFHGGQAFHEEIFMLLPLAVYFFVLNQKKWSAWFWVLGFMVIGILSYKNTSYLVLVLTIGYIALLLVAKKYVQFRRDRFKLAAIGYGFVVGVLAVAATIALVVVSFQDKMPSGSPEVRTYAYEVAWKRFLKSPIYGTAYAENTNVDFDAFDMGGYVVTHSDFMDALQHGGVIGTALFIASYLVPFRLSRTRKPAANPRLRASLHGLRAITLGGILVLLFNPVVLNLPLNTMFWLNAGLLAGLGWRYREERRVISTQT